LINAKPTIKIQPGIHRVSNYGNLVVKNRLLAVWYTTYPRDISGSIANKGSNSVRRQ